MTSVESAVAPPLSNARAVAHFDLSAGQLPENIALSPDGSAILSFTGSLQVALVTAAGRMRVLATLPGADSPSGQASIAGLVRAGDGTVYVAYRSGDTNRERHLARVPGQPSPARRGVARRRRHKRTRG